MREPSVSVDVRTITLPSVKGDGLRALSALTHQAKNLYNTALFLVRQVFTAYEYDSENKISRMKSDLLQSQIDAIEAYNDCIEYINKKRTAKYPAQCKKAKAEGKEPSELKLLPFLEETSQSDPEVLEFGNSLHHLNFLNKLTKKRSFERFFLLSATFKSNVA